MQNFVFTRSSSVWRKTLLRYDFKQKVSVAPLNNLVTRNYSLYSSDSKTIQRNNLPYGKCLVGSTLLQSHLNVNSLSIARRFLSDGTGKTENLNDQLLLPNSPKIFDLTEGSSQELLQSLQAPLTNEISITTLNLGSNYTPIGWCVHFLDFLHSAMPWWGTIALATVILRVATFPVAIIAQKNAAKLNELLPEQTKLQEKISEARLAGDEAEFSRLQGELQTLFKRHNINPLKSMLAPMAQIPVFLTFFLTLRRMANYPVESLKTGGFYWVQDLSLPDPLYVLPVICSLTLWASLEISFRSGLNPNQNLFIKYGIRVLPLITFAFTFHFPAAIMTYWCINNFITTIQVVALKQPKVRDFLNIPQLKTNPMTLPMNQKNIRKHFKDSMDNVKIKRLMEERRTIDEINFKKAGIGPLKKTFKEDPTRAKSNS